MARFWTGTSVKIGKMTCFGNIEFRRLLTTALCIKQRIFPEKILCASHFSEFSMTIILQMDIEKSVDIEKDTNEKYYEKGERFG